jgi:hypothetical protein
MFEPVKYLKETCQISMIMEELNFVVQLAVNGRKLYDCRPGELAELMLRVRTTLMSRNFSGQCRCWLLLALDLASNRYAPLSGQLQGFYQVSAFLKVQHL